MAIKDQIIRPNNEPREYVTQIDFSSEHQNWGMRGEFMLHMSKAKVLDFVEYVMADDSFAITIRPNFGGTKNACIVLECMTCYKAVEHILTMLRYARLYQASICYKEGEFGYEIDHFGAVKNKWLIDDGMC